MIHELAHFVGPETGHPNTIDDFSDFGLRNGDIQHASSFQAMRIAECYANFAHDASLNI